MLEYLGITCGDVGRGVTGVRGSGVPQDPAVEPLWALGGQDVGADTLGHLHSQCHTWVGRSRAPPGHWSGW